MQVLFAAILYRLRAAIANGSVEARFEGSGRYTLSAETMQRGVDREGRLREAKRDTPDADEAARSSWLPVAMPERDRNSRPEPFNHDGRYMN